MAVEVVGFETVQGPAENSAEEDKPVSQEIENGKLEKEAEVAEAVPFGSHGDESAQPEEEVAPDSNVPKDAAEDWPAPKQIHSYYFVRFRPYDDPIIKANLDKLDKEMSQKNQARIQVTDALRAKRSERAELISQIKSLRDDNKQFQSIVDEKIKEIEPLQQALGKLRTTNNSGRGGALCSSEDELNNLISSLQYHIQHESIPLAEEKQILREIKQLEGTREKVIANAVMRAKVQDSMGQKEAIQDQVKLIGGDLDGAKKERQVIRSKIKQLDDAVKALDKDIQSLQDELGAVTEKRDKAYENIQQLRKQRDQGNSYFYQSRAIMNKARELAAKKDINALEEIVQTEVEKVMSLWNSDKSFRDDYEKRLLPSLDMRQLSRDGRMRNPDEKPLLEEPKPVETGTLPKTIVKQSEGSKSVPQETVPEQKFQKETKKKGKDLKSNVDSKVLEDADDYEFEMPKETTVKEPPINPEMLKEKKREEEIAKAKQALERKKKLAEKAAAKAAIRAQKEAEKKLKEREKKAKKAAGGPGFVSNPEELATDVAEDTEQKNNANMEASVAPAPAAPAKVQKENSVRPRIRSKALKGAPESIPKAILKRKRSQNYWLWIVSCVLIVLAALVLAFIILS
ncbi:proton pump-interactor 1 [Vigna radiata var. radiata]|uniref:Proton pump-interactor 1 n=1 Tax=Vigna radiata var. radiata TaxID=3916 RepID=A0A1S3TL48_VIGRR|nr:proton pump-interactor 1 [Vigna radiata var. radiata]XP_014494488.1 proton pump-interactor 1 [Vigna radiata var. radiata]XP_014494489.1 proton pump-interactor 1 [Vigna radiata var. radiata]XP_014494490.1 proton pump-interactor 1 [Vigna radiata var. radiata]XP_022634441.1 proton pump-interactor 1 [Vigna radiata var. radiata]XP_022634442.1 proton pump-interactor 1 [Vigna radiata var. radiata]